MTYVNDMVGNSDGNVILVTFILFLKNTDEFNPLCLAKTILEAFVSIR